MYIRTPACCGIMIVSMWPAAAVAAIDCQAVKTSRVPYELRMQSNDSSPYAIQIYRDSDYVRLQYTKVRSYSIIAKFQTNFHLESKDGPHETRFIYHIPTDRFIWQQDSLTVKYNTIIDGKATAGPGFEQVYVMLPDAAILVGGCSFEVKHFRLKQASPVGASDEEIWFSPELNTNLKVIFVSTSRSGETRKWTIEAKGVTTEFVPMRR